jgi:hypothetical protein
MRQVSVLLICLGGWLFLAWVGSVFNFTTNPVSYIAGCVVMFGASWLWE